MKELYYYYNDFLEIKYSQIDEFIKNISFFENDIMIIKNKEIFLND